MNNSKGESRLQLHVSLTMGLGIAKYKLNQMRRSIYFSLYNYKLSHKVNDVCAFNVFQV